MATPFTQSIKLAYDYEHETKELQQYHRSNQDMPKRHVGESALTGGGVGALVGAGVGLLAAAGRVPLNGMNAAMAGVVVGTIGGARLGALGALAVNSGIDHSRAIMEQPAKDRKAMLASVARRREIAEREAREWERAHYQTARSDLRRIYI